jgi:hypothetical protein
MNILEVNDSTASAIRYRDEILTCLAENSSAVMRDGGAGADLRAYLEDAFITVGARYDNPDYESLLKVMRLLAARELKAGKSAKTIAENFHRIAKMITQEPEY